MKKKKTIDALTGKIGKPITITSKNIAAIFRKAKGLLMRHDFLTRDGVIFLRVVKPPKNLFGIPVLKSKKRNRPASHVKPHKN